MHSRIIAGRVVRQILKDRRTLALMFIAPLMVIFLLYTVFNSAATSVTIETIALPDMLQTALSEQSDLLPSTDLNASLERLKAREIDGVAIYSEPKLTVYVEGSEASVVTAVRKAVTTAVAAFTTAQTREALQKFTAASRANSAAVSVVQTVVSLQFLNGSEDTTGFNHIAHLLMGFFIFFFVFIIAGVAFLRERTSGTLERLLATPIRRYQIVLGYFGGFGVFVFLQTLLIQAYMVGVLGVPLEGDFALVMLINLLLAAGSLALGTLLSAFARNELQLFQFIPIVIVPQVLFCGLFSLRGAPEWVVWLSKAFPLTYAASALTDVAIRGQGIATLWPDLLALSGYIVVFLILNTVVLKKYRTI